MLFNDIPRQIAPRENIYVNVLHPLVITVKDINSTASL